MKYYIIAGEASGDLHASNLMKALQKEDANAGFRFWGGDLMQNVGGNLVKHYKERAFMGFIEVIKNLNTIFKDISFCKKVGIDGVVIGVLNEKSEIDVAKSKLLLAAAAGMQTTFHRAFDCLNNPLEGLTEIIELGFDRVLTSGLAPTAVEGQDLLKKLIEKAKNDIMILPGSGLNSKNIAAFVKNTNAKEIHASAKKVIYPIDKSLFSIPYFETDIIEVQRLNAILQQFN